MGHVNAEQEKSVVGIREYVCWFVSVGLCLSLQILLWTGLRHVGAAEQGPRPARRHREEMGIVT